MFASSIEDTDQKSVRECHLESDCNQSTETFRDEVLDEAVLNQTDEYRPRVRPNRVPSKDSLLSMGSCKIYRQRSNCLVQPKMQKVQEHPAEENHDC